MRALQPQLNFRESLNSYASLFGRSLKASFAYRASTVTSLVTAVFMYATQFLLWRYVYTQKSNLAISSAQMFPYLLLAGCVNYAVSMSVEFRVGQRIRQGLIATDLLKPVDFQIAQGIQALSDGLFNGALGMVFFFSGYLVLGKDIFPASLLSFALFLASFLLAFLIQYFVCFVFVQGAFYTYSGYGIFAARGALQQTFSGVFAPPHLLSCFLKNCRRMAPFSPHHLHARLHLYGLGAKSEALDLILQQLGWVAGLYLLGKFLMVKSLKQLEVQGG